MSVGAFMVSKNKNYGDEPGSLTPPWEVADDDLEIRIDKKINDTRWLIAIASLLVYYFR